MRALASTGIVIGLMIMAVLARPAPVGASGQPSPASVARVAPGGTRRGCEIRNTQPARRRTRPDDPARHDADAIRDLADRGAAPGTVQTRTDPNPDRRQPGSRLLDAVVRRTSPFAARAQASPAGGALSAGQAVFHDAHAPPSRSSLA